MAKSATPATPKAPANPAADVLALFTAAQAKAQPLENKPQTNQTYPVTCSFDVEKWQDLALEVMQTYPDLKPNIKAIESAGAGSGGDAIVLAAFAAPKGGGKKGRNVVMYYTGKVVFTNLDPVPSVAAQVSSQ